MAPGKSLLVRRRRKRAQQQVGEDEEESHLSAPDSNTESSGATEDDSSDDTESQGRDQSSGNISAINESGLSATDTDPAQPAVATSQTQTSETAPAQAVRPPAVDANRNGDRPKPPQPKVIQYQDARRYPPPPGWEERRRYRETNDWYGRAGSRADQGTWDRNRYERIPVKRFPNHRDHSLIDYSDIIALLFQSPLYVKIPGDSTSKIMKGYFKRAHNLLPLPDHSILSSRRPMRIFLPTSTAKIVYPPLGNAPTTVSTGANGISSPDNVNLPKMEQSESKGPRLFQKSGPGASVESDWVNPAPQGSGISTSSKLQSTDNGAKAISGDTRQRQDEQSKPILNSALSAQNERLNRPHKPQEKFTTQQTSKQAERYSTSLDQKENNPQASLSTAIKAKENGQTDDADLDVDDDSSKIPKVRLPPASVYAQAIPQPASETVAVPSPGPLNYPAVAYQRPVVAVQSGPSAVVYPPIDPAMGSVMMYPVPAIPMIPQEYRLTPEVMHQPRPTKAMSVADIEAPVAHSPADGQTQSHRRGYSPRPRALSNAHRGPRMDGSDSGHGSRGQHSQHYYGSQPQEPRSKGMARNSVPRAYSQAGYTGEGIASMPYPPIIVPNGLIPFTAGSPQPIVSSGPTNTYTQETNGMVYFYDPMQYYPYYPEGAPTPPQPTPVAIPVSAGQQVDGGVYYYSNMPQSTAYYQ